MIAELSSASRQIIRRKVASCRHGQNVRSDLGSEEDLRRLGQSIKRRQLTPWLILPDGQVIDGNRSLAACRLEGVEEIDCIVVEEDLTPSQYKAIQLAAAIHRSDISAYDKAAGVRDIKAENPGMTNKQIADELLDMDAGYITKLLSLFDCLPEVQKAAQAGRIGANDWYAISKSADQAATLGLKLGGASREEIQRASRKPKAASVRTARIRCPLPTGVNVLVAGTDISLEEAIDSLSEAVKLMKAALAKGLNIKTAVRYWSDIAAN